MHLGSFAGNGDDIRVSCCVFLVGLAAALSQTDYAETAVHGGTVQSEGFGPNRTQTSCHMRGRFSLSQGRRSVSIWMLSNKALEVTVQPSEASHARQANF